MTRSVALLSVAAFSLVPTSLAAHPHSIDNKRDQVIANGMNHPLFELNEDGLYDSCLDNTLPSDYGPAWYGLERAHHGADASDPGRADGCYMLEDGILPGQDTDTNPAFN